MATNVAFVGLSRSGLSAALALAGQSKEIHLTGWDSDENARENADRSKIFTPVCKRAVDAVRDTNLVILALPTDEVQPTLKELMAALRRDVPILALSPLHTQLREWVQAALGKQVPFISIYPAPTAISLEDLEFGPHAARADEYEESPVYIAAAQDTPPALLDLAVDFAVLLGGYPVFSSPEELDGLISANLLLHQLTAAVLMKTAAEQPSWQEGKAIAGKALFHTTLPLEELPERAKPGLTAFSNSENLARLLDGLIRNYIQIREDLRASNPEKVAEVFGDALSSRGTWLLERRKAQKSARLATSVPGRAEALKRLLALGR